MRALSRSVLPVLLAGLFAGVGCAAWSPSFDRGPGGTLVHRDLGFRIGQPAPVAGGTWKRTSVDGTVLSFRYAGPRGAERARGGTTLAMMAACSDYLMSPQLAALNLQIGLESDRTLYSHPVAHLGNRGWSQHFEARRESGVAQVVGVTLIVDRCVYDWVLVTPEESPELFQVFEDWWVGFVPATDVPEDLRRGSSPGASAG